MLRPGSGRPSEGVPYLEGWNAHKKGQSPKSNPYDWISQRGAHREWLSGWKRAARAGPNPYDFEASPGLHLAWRAGFLAGKDDPPTMKHAFKSCRRVCAWLDGYASHGT